MNYKREYAGKDPLPQQSMVTELYNPYTQERLSETAVKTYNMYTEHFNKSRYRATQEFYLDQRFKYLHAVIDIQ